ncbi:uncharacterized protein LOC105232390 [Bactrocera dorsalis]|uniref:Uncharacterized protein LOC105232390 n=1 Tax=Bactrocera dorsalis TaxID=27457 RepID=A0A6I9W5Y8_BACDO|nr:uncharacterized protein LOC105232390 [Bactrocera dorsalis]
MLKEASFLAFALLLLIQFAASLPRPSSSESQEDNTIPHGTTTTTPSALVSATSSARKQLEANVYKSFVNFLDFRLQRTNKIAQDVLADPVMNSIDSPAMEEERKVLRKYVKDSKEALIAVLPADKNDQHNRFFFAIGKDFVLENFNSFNRRRASKTEELTPEQRVSWNALKKHGVLEYNAEMEQRGKDFAYQIVDDFDYYVKALTSAEKEKEKEMVEVWNMYKKNALGLDKAEFGQRLFLELFQYDSKA